MKLDSLDIVEALLRTSGEVVEHPTVLEPGKYFSFVLAAHREMPKTTLPAILRCGNGLDMLCPVIVTSGTRAEIRAAVIERLDEVLDNFERTMK